ncbi:hypothetical protein GCM10009839_49200 [Catenulispora yoronensis]|uniref:WXG100 family type VII secretion target n=1 Tax=Catenulispora yoronensis TaxID=450799 RepID=A0ABN2UNW1_9ACTN
MPDQPTPDQSFSIHLKSLTDFADEFTTQIESIQAPMDHLATMSDTPPQYGAFSEAWALGAGEQAAIEEMYSLLGQVKQAIAFAGTVTGTVADGYRRADENISQALGGSPPVGSQSYEHGGPVHVGNDHSGPDHGHSWQHTQVDGDNKASFPDSTAPGSTAPGSTAPGATDATSAAFVANAPGDPSSSTAVPVSGFSSPVGHLVTGAQPSDGALPVWTPPPATATPAVAPAVAPAPTTGPDPSWTSYFQGTPQGGV